MKDIPELISARLVLRAMRREDFAAFAAIWADPAVTAQIGVAVRTTAESWTAFLVNIGHWQVEGFGQWAITDRATEAFLGQTGMFRAHRGYGAAFDDWPEAGWVLTPAAQGQGLGLEATEAAHGWFDRVVGGPLVARIAEGNDASRALAARLGYRLLVGEVVGVPGRELFRRQPR